MGQKAADDFGIETDQTLSESIGAKFRGIFGFKMRKEYRKVEVTVFATRGPYFDIYI
jgi:hypothetical protein